MEISTLASGCFQKCWLSDRLRDFKSWDDTVNLVRLKHTLLETKNVVCKVFVSSTSQDTSMLNTVWLAGCSQIIDAAALTGTLRRGLQLPLGRASC